MTYFTFFLFFFFNFLFLKNHEYIAKKINLYDLNSKKKISLLGGFFLILNIYLIFITFYFQIFPNEHFFKFNNFLLITAIFLVGFFDDKIKIGINIRLFSIIFFLFIFFHDQNYLITSLRFSFESFSLYVFNSNVISIIFSIFCVISLINALNFFDGINLQVIIYSIIVFIYLLVIQYSFFLIILILALIFFGYLNFYNKSFLGDSGTYVLAIVIALSVIDLHNNNLIYADQICFLLLIPGLDMIRLFLERVYKRKNPFRGDLQHIHHLMKKKIQSGPQYIVLITSFLPIIFYEILSSKFDALVISFLIYFVLIIYLKKNEI